MVEAAAPTTNEVIPATNKLIGKVDAIYVPNDTTVVAALETVVKIGKETKTPVFTGETRGVGRGAVASVGLNYTQVGMLAGYMVAEVLNGKKPGDIDAVIAYEKVPDNDVVVNKASAEAMGVTLPESVLSARPKSHSSEPRDVPAPACDRIGSVFGTADEMFMSLYEILGTVEIGLVFGLVALGAFISFRILDFPDLTVEGSFPLGAAVLATLIVAAGLEPVGGDTRRGGRRFLRRPHHRLSQRSLQYLCTFSPASCWRSRSIPSTCVSWVGRTSRCSAASPSSACSKAGARRPICWRQS